MSARIIEELQVGKAAELAKTFDEWDIDTFAALTGGLVHADGAFAERTNPGEKAAHSLLTAGLISTVLDTKLPGPGTICLSQQLQFLRPVKMGDTITARVEVIELVSNQDMARLRTTCTNQNGELVLDGTALVIPAHKGWLGDNGWEEAKSALRPEPRAD
ncbi:MAG: MaoC family dehydratase [candidate division NC10 bacterium]|nr:MaoC family dehydratase [candidate division NC10 bacterium]